MQTTTQDIIKILPKGLITIPKKWRQALGFEENSLARMRKEGNKLILEPVNVVSYPLRDYSKEEIEEFIKADRVSPQLREKVQKLLK